MLMEVFFSNDLIYNNLSWLTLSCFSSSGCWTRNWVTSPSQSPATRSRNTSATHFLVSIILIWNLLYFHFYLYFLYLSQSTQYISLWETPSSKSPPPRPQHCHLEFVQISIYFCSQLRSLKQIVLCQFCILHFISSWLTLWKPMMHFVGASKRWCENGGDAQSYQ